MKKLPHKQPATAAQAIAAKRAYLSKPLQEQPPSSDGDDDDVQFAENVGSVSAGSTSKQRRLWRDWRILNIISLDELVLGAFWISNVVAIFAAYYVQDASGAVDAVMIFSFLGSISLLFFLLQFLKGILETPSSRHYPGTPRRSTSKSLAKVDL